MLQTKIKRFIVSVKKNWREAFYTSEFELNDSKILSKAITKQIMDVNIEHRLTVLKKVQTDVLIETKQQVVALEKQKLQILSKLELYEKV